MAFKEFEPLLLGGADDNEEYDFVLVVVNPFSHSNIGGKYAWSYS
jgi:hypothetical protein